MEFTGKIIAILQPRGGVSKTSGNEWKAQEYVIENHDQYPKKMCFDIFGADKIEQFNIQMGEELTVSFDIDARQWQDRWFNSIRAWKVERVGAGAPWLRELRFLLRHPLRHPNLLPVTQKTICLSKQTSFGKRHKTPKVLQVLSGFYTFYGVRKRHQTHLCKSIPHWDIQFRPYK